MFGGGWEGTSGCDLHFSEPPMCLEQVASEMSSSPAALSCLSVQVSPWERVTQPGRGSRSAPQAGPSGQTSAPPGHTPPGPRLSISPGVFQLGGGSRGAGSSVVPSGQEIWLRRDREAGCPLTGAREQRLGGEPAWGAALYLLCGLLAPAGDRPPVSISLGPEVLSSGHSPRPREGCWCLRLGR